MSKFMSITKILVLVFGVFPLVGLAQTLPIEQAIITSPPLVPPPITRDHPAKVIVKMKLSRRLWK